MPKAGEIRYCPALGGEAKDAAFVWIPPGSFWMGDKNEEKNPVRFTVITKGYWLQQTLLTERQYSGKDSDLPKVDTSWNNVYHFCQGKQLRMPTEAEWEYAARANTGHKYRYSGSNAVNNVAWTEANSGGKRHRVGQLKSNNLGLFDMSGTVFEWCHDLYKDSASSAPQVNPTGPASETRRAHRGGGWGDGTLNAWVVFRGHNIPDTPSIYIGVRLIWEPQHA